MCCALACGVPSSNPVIFCNGMFNPTPFKNLCIAGGVALNCVANGKLLRENIFEKIWIQPAAGDAGGALGAALGFWYKELKKERVSPLKDEMQGSYLGPDYSVDEIEKTLKNLGSTYQKLSEEEVLRITAQELSNEKTIGWFQGRMEFGPRALGARSIIATCDAAAVEFSTLKIEAVVSLTIT